MPTSSFKAEGILRERVGFHSIAADKGKPKYRTLNLWPGKDIKIIGIDEVPLQPTGESALHVKYQTTLPVADNSALRDEIVEVWSRFTTDLTLAKKHLASSRQWKLLKKESRNS